MKTQDDLLAEWWETTSWDEVLHDWTITGRETCGCAVYQRPHAPGEACSTKSLTAHDVGCSRKRTDDRHPAAVIWSDNVDDDLLDLRDRYGKTLSAFAIYAALNHGGDFSEAWDALGLGGGCDYDEEEFAERHGYDFDDDEDTDEKAAQYADYLDEVAEQAQDDLDRAQAARDELDEDDEDSTRPGGFTDDELAEQKRERDERVAEAAAKAEKAQVDAADAREKVTTPAGQKAPETDAEREQRRLDRETAKVLRARQAKRNADKIEAAELYGDVGEVVELTGDAVVEVVDVAESFLIESLWSRTRPQVLLYARAKLGKSTLGHNIVAALLAGTKLFGRYRTEAPAGRIGIIDTEMTAEHLTSEFGLHWPEVRDNSGRLSLWALGQKGMARKFDVSDPAVRLEWIERLKAANIEVLIVDCLGPLLRAAGIDENTDAAVFMEHIREVCDRAGVKAHLIVDHASSKQGKEDNGARGDSKKMDTADALWKFSAAKDAKGEKVPGRFVLDVEGRDGSAKIDLFREPDQFRFQKVFFDDDPQYRIEADASLVYPVAKKLLAKAPNGELGQTKLRDGVVAALSSSGATEPPGEKRVRAALKNLAVQRCLTTSKGRHNALNYALGTGEPIKPRQPLKRADTGKPGGAKMDDNGELVE